MASFEYNTDTLDPALAAVAAAVSDMTPVMEAIGELLLVSAQDRMRDGEQPDGTPFAPRKQSTLDRYAKLGLTFGASLNVSGDRGMSGHPTPSRRTTGWATRAG